MIPLEIFRVDQKGFCPACELREGSVTVTGREGWEIHSTHSERVCFLPRLTAIQTAAIQRSHRCGGRATTVATGEHWTRRLELSPRDNIRSGGLEIQMKAVGTRLK